MSEWESCFDCKYSGSAKNMQSCAWKSGLASAYNKCEHYEKDWSKAILPYIFIGGFLAVIIRLIIIGIWGI